MEDLVIYGAGGFGREVAYLIEKINEQRATWNIKGFIEDNEANIGKMVNGYPILGTGEWLLSYNQKINVVIAVGSTLGKKIIYNKLKNCKNIEFPNIIHPGVSISSTNKLGVGNIICEGVIMTCNINISNFVSLHVNCTLGHDVRVDDFSTILPNSSISGNVHLNEGVYFGTNATIIQNIKVGEYSIIGAGAVVIRDIPAYCTAVGIPAKPIKFHQ
ncbi:acetyltransferase [Geobacillus subterraneus]|uniref:acetyltransferase n=1 Tax=Geobacillus subterraneus TaxID=129338 RepID=UPI001442BD97|nr:acetyltransferase [Geobacillus subterraneus]QIZ66039.1 acetyltransferase [Geobacillus subterraneus]